MDEISGVGSDNGDFLHQFVRMVEASTWAASSYDDFREFVRSYVRPIFPHKMLIVAVGRVTFDQISVEELVAVDYPQEYVDKINRHTNFKNRPVVAEWFAKQTPLLIDPSLQSTKMSELELKEVREYGLGKLAIHGQIDIAQRMATYFSFAGVPDLKPECSKMLELIIPHAHNVLMKAFRATLGKRRCVLLTEKEIEVMKWIVLGRTNSEIAIILSKSEKTVRNQIQSILRKMDVSNRTELISKADEVGYLLELKRVVDR